MSVSVKPGYFGRYGGRFVPEVLVPAIDELTAAYEEAKADPRFQEEFMRELQAYSGRPTPLYRADRLTEMAGGAVVYLKREDLNHTGSHKINNAIGQILLARRMGKKRIIAETGAGQHGVATATVCAKYGLECVVYMGEEDIRRQALNVFRMKLLGAEVRPVASGSRTLKDATNEAIRDWVTHVETTYYLIGSVVGMHPYPTMVRDFQSVIGREARAQILEQEGRLPDAVVACVGGGSNAMGIFYPFPSEDPGRFGWYRRSRRQVKAWTAATPPRFPGGRPVCCTARSATSCRTTTGRSSCRIPSPPASTIPGWDRNTPTSRIRGGRSTWPSPTRRRWRAFCSSPRRKGSSRLLKAPTR